MSGSLGIVLSSASAPTTPPPPPPPSSPTPSIIHETTVAWEKGAYLQLWRDCVMRMLVALHAMKHDDGPEHAAAVAEVSIYSTDSHPRPWPPALL